MIKFKKTILFLVVLNFGNLLLNAQNSRCLSIALTSESIAFPFTACSPINPGLECGLTLKQIDKKILTRSFLLYLGGYHHSKVENGFYIRFDYQNSLKVKNALAIDFPLGIGYLHSFYPGEVYIMDVNTGDFNKEKQWGHAHAILKTGIGIRYIKNSKLQPYIKQEILLESSFLYNIPVIAHSFIKIGVILKIKSHD
jgi:hypothetical protein